MAERIIETSQLLSDMKIRESKCYLISFKKCKIISINTNEICYSAKKEITNIAVDLFRKCSAKWGKDTRAALLGDIIIIARRNEFVKFIRMYGYDDESEALIELLESS